MKQGQSLRRHLPQIKIVAFPEVGGLYYRYERRTA
jgi:hypothetical protein